jgi:hypothetical protein
MPGGTRPAVASRRTPFPARDLATRSGVPGPPGHAAGPAPGAPEPVPAGPSIPAVAMAPAEVTPAPHPSAATLPSQPPRLPPPRPAAPGEPKPAGIVVAAPAATRTAGIAAAERGRPPACPRHPHGRHPHARHRRSCAWLAARRPAQPPDQQQPPPMLLGGTGFQRDRRQPPLAQDLPRPRPSAGHGRLQRAQLQPVMARPPDWPGVGRQHPIPGRRVSENRPRQGIANPSSAHPFLLP